MLDMMKRNKKILQKFNYDPEVPIKVTLYDFQKAGINFAYRALKKYKSIIIADEQGLGKTIEALALCFKLKSVRRVLVICPGGARGEWKRIIHDFTNASYTAVYGREAFETRTKFLIVNYDRLKGVYEKGWRKKFDCIIVDEFHNIKNKDTIRAKLFTGLKSKYTIYLSGTPILNRLEELWVVLSKIDYDTFGNYVEYTKKYSKIKMIRIKAYWGRRVVYRYIRKYFGGKNIDELQKLIAPYFIRRRKKEVLKSLPSKIYQNILVELRPAQQKIYDRLTKELKIKISKRTIKMRSAMAEFTRARQICGTLATIGLKDESASLDELENFAKDNLYGDHKFFIVAPFRMTATMAYERLRKLKIRAVYVDGSVKASEAVKRRKAFQNDNRIKAYVGTIDANKEALTLTAADYAIFIGRSVVPKINEQTEDRLHRIGQRKVVNVINIINKDTVEEKIEEHILLPKARLFSEMFDGIKSEKLTLDQMRALL